MDSKMKQIDMLTKIMQMVISSKVCPQTSAKDWAKIILQAHNKGYLYVLMDKDDIRACVCAYRINDWDEKYSDVMPIAESGNKLYVAWAVSDGNPMSLVKMLNAYKKQHPIDEIMYYKDNSNTNFKRFILKEGVIA